MKYFFQTLKYYKFISDIIIGLKCNILMKKVVFFIMQFT